MNKKKEKFHYLKDRIMLYNCTSEVYSNCFICNSEFHLFNKCRRVFYIPEKDFIIKKFNKINEEEGKKRKKLKRKNKKKFNSLEKSKFLTENSSNYYIKINKIIEIQRENSMENSDGGLESYAITEEEDEEKEVFDEIEFKKKPSSTETRISLTPILKLQKSTTKTLKNDEVSLKTTVLQYFYISSRLKFFML